MTTRTIYQNNLFHRQAVANENFVLLLLLLFLLFFINVVVIIIVIVIVDSISHFSSCLV